jgi:hypothetical protein
MVKIVIALVLLAHGIGHSMGMLQVFKVATVNPSWNGDSWLLTGVVGTTVTQVVGSVLWIVAIVGFTALAGSVMGWLPAGWFQPLAVGSAVASLAGLLLFPLAFPTFSTIGALVIDVLVLAATIWYGWQPDEVAL